MTPQGKYIFASPIACVLNELTVLSIDITPQLSCTLIWLRKPAVNSHTVSENWHELPVSCCWEIFVKTSPRMLMLMISHMTTNFSFEQTDFSIDVKTLSRAQDQVRLLKYSSHTKIFNYRCFKRFAAFINHFLSCWLT